MRGFLAVLTFLSISVMLHHVSAQCCDDENIYWEQLSDCVKEATIVSGEVDAIAIDYYKGNFRFSDDEQSFRLLDIVTLKSENEHVKALYFYLFNDACEKSDGAIAEVLGGYCLEIVVNDPVYVLNYFKSHSRIMELYAHFLGYEFYFKEKRMSDIKYDFDSFKQLICSAIKGHDSLEYTVRIFNEEIKEMMENMENIN